MENTQQTPTIPNKSYIIKLKQNNETRPNDEIFAYIWQAWQAFARFDGFQAQFWMLSC